MIMSCDSPAAACLALQASTWMHQAALPNSSGCPAACSPLRRRSRVMHRLLAGSLGSSADAAELKRRCGRCPGSGRPLVSAMRHQKRAETASLVDTAQAAALRDDTCRKREKKGEGEGGRCVCEGGRIWHAIRRCSYRYQTNALHVCRQGPRNDPGSTK